jgi:hypothetical protein
MKKLLYAIAILSVAALAFSSCGKKDPEENKIVKRLTMCGDKWDKYYFFYNADGTIKDVKRNPETDMEYDYERTWEFTWEGKVGTAKYTNKGKVAGNWVFTLGDNGYLTTWANEYGDTWAFSYDSDNHVTKIVRSDKNPEVVKANCVWENGDLSKWSRFKDSGAEEWKIQSFLADENIGGIFADATDKADVARWIFELGLVGKPSKHLLDQAAWEGAEKSAVHTYEKDEDGFVTKVSKVYGTDDPEIYEYAWEVVK